MCVSEGTLKSLKLYQFLNKTGLHTTFMRFLIRTRIPTESGNKMVKDPDFLRKLEDYINKVKPEASYFMPIEGQRSAAFIVNANSNDQLPAMVEPLYQW